MIVLGESSGMRHYPTGGSIAMITRVLYLTVFAVVSVLGAPAGAFEGEKPLHEAAKKEKEFTWYTTHYHSETAAALCNGQPARGNALRDPPPA